MSYALDTNVLARSIEASHPRHSTAKLAVEKLIDSGEELVIFP
jgi:predicted nucleic acid-binding protein